MISYNSFFNLPDLVYSDLNIRSLSACTCTWLMHHDTAVSETAARIRFIATVTIQRRRSAANRHRREHSGQRKAAAHTRRRFLSPNLEKDLAERI